MKQSTESTSTDRKIIGFSLPPTLAAEVKTEAARRGMTLRKLFEEAWATYKQTQAK